MERTTNWHEIIYYYSHTTSPIIAIPHPPLPPCFLFFSLPPPPPPPQINYICKIHESESILRAEAKRLASRVAISDKETRAVLREMEMIKEGGQFAQVVRESDVGERGKRVEVGLRLRGVPEGTFRTLVSDCK